MSGKRRHFWLTCVDQKAFLITRWLTFTKHKERRDDQTCFQPFASSRSSLEAGACKRRLTWWNFDNSSDRLKEGNCLVRLSAFNVYHTRAKKYGRYNWSKLAHHRQGPLFKKWIIGLSLSFSLSLSLSLFFNRKFSKFAYHHKHIRKSDKEISYGERPYACADKESHTTSSEWRQKKRQSEYEELNNVNTKTCKKEILTALRSTIPTPIIILISKWINEIFCINV